MEADPFVRRELDASGSPWSSNPAPKTYSSHDMGHSAKMTAFRAIGGTCLVLGALYGVASLFR